MGEYADQTGTHFLAPQQNSETCGRKVMATPWMNWPFTQQCTQACELEQACGLPYSSTNSCVLEI
jgi:hypothetical protein